MDSSDQEQQVRERHQQGHQGSTELPDDSPSSATCDLKSAVANFGARFLVPSCFRSPSGLPHALPLTRVYQVWPGKNVFFFDGKVICGPDPRGLILTAISVLLSEWIFLADIVDPSSKHPILIAAFSIALAATVIVTLLLTATRDPGIIPRNQASPSEEASASSLRRTRSRRIIIDGIETKQKYCRICRIFRPPRSSHCAVCDNCVDKFDHHCPWIGQCIGLRNYRLYLLLISLALAFHIYTFTFSVRRIRVKMDATSAGIFSLLRTMPEMFALAAFSFMAIWFLACLLPLHAFLVAKNQTSHERYKGRYRDSPNPYDKGALKNIKGCLFDKLPPPRVDFRAVAGATPGSAARTTVSSASPATDGGAGEMLPLGMQDCTVLGANDAQRIKLVD